MLFQSPDHQTLYTALVERNPAYDGRVYVAVRSTGVFCRLTCPARKPKSENCQFFESVAECIDAGYRPCKRCYPLAPAAETDPSIQKLLSALEQNPAYRWGEDDIIKHGLDPSTVRRLFKRHFGITFLEMARRSRIRDGFETISNGGRMIDAQLDAGFSSPSAFRTAFAKLLGTTPAHFTNDALLRADWIDTPLGAMVAVSDKSALHLLEFADRKALPTELQKLRKLTRNNLGFGRFDPTDQIEAELSAFFQSKKQEFTVPLALHGTPFTRHVWQALREIPVGETRSYSDIARRIGRPTATRAVAQANGANQIAIVIPCHRVIGADGSLTGYGGGLWRKQKLIELEHRVSSELQR
ncbi:trifunctional transcriptional activator/DNA repair protein Ada/methylated-DNA--[protein]-cysteine S-methyltransferase [Kiloniella laminariae]|uniref:Trifunctional transcriptional activator/DNA repair protein Ada/methylated-DNA--[protein]-cysteine S-methyltransferase n=1 Tax=Kiloniella laminariae TaxID=454162 RepID=A0ABT4LDM2_9PROT|nr:trifunctional transcriptional activator/DNA repair protein Ada/methylated-DNA--[protein]-cysteine S-methyltransferase [Kiloniella laminariae]MCZ4279197.1 trifunctional transcriptional activator/DNA repair protein Ada/methylated-DNA--[protein]-cysteine S-methyltransferase [Kiloniella laminariae]